MPGVRSEWKVSQADATRFVADRLAGSDVEALQQGLWSSSYVFRRGSERLVIRFSGLSDDFEKDAWIAERAPAALPVPQMLDIGDALGGYFAVSRWAPGRHLDALTADELRRALPSLFAALDAIRDIDLRGTSGFGGWADGRGEEASWREALLSYSKDDPARDPRWQERLEASVEASRALHAGKARLTALLDLLPEQRWVVHSDLLHYNVLVADDRVTAVLDWGSSIFGDFVYDVAWLSFWEPWNPQWSGIDLAAEARRHYGEMGIEVPRFAERLRAGELRIGLESLVWYSARADEVNLRRASARLEELG